MPVICPTITAFSLDEYKAQVGNIQTFAKRVHIDLMDGVFAPTTSPSLSEIYLPDGIISDIHLMYQKPMDELEQLIKIKPNLVVFHYEAEVDASHCAVHLKENGVKAGLALLQNTSVENVLEILPSFDHVLIFSGDLGHHGGEADLNLLSKVQIIKEKFPEIEIAWDGGISGQNAKQLVGAGVEVLNTGGFIQDADNPEEQYKKLEELVS